MKTAIELLIEYRELDKQFDVALETHVDHGSLLVKEKELIKEIDEFIDNLDE